jgi:hypothetical protein
MLNIVTYERLEKQMKAKSNFTLIFLMLSALVLSVLIGELTHNIGYLKWLTWGDSIGFDTVNLDLSIIHLSFAFHMQVNVVQIVLVATALLMHKKIR